MTTPANIKTIETNVSEYCDDAPHAIRIDEAQFETHRRVTAPALTNLGLDYGVIWFADMDYTMLDEDGNEISEEDEPYGYHQQLKVYKDGRLQIAWRHKHDSTCEFWVAL